MAILRRKKNGEGGEEAPAAEGALSFNPERARAFFDRAKTVHDSTQYEYAMTLWLNGLRQDPANLSAIEGFFHSAGAFNGRKGKLSKETLRSFPDRGSEIDKLLAALLQWGVKQADASLAVRAAELSAKIHDKSDVDMSEVAYWIAEKALVLIPRGKPRKGQYVDVMEAAKKVGAYDLAVQAGDEACKLDPSDSDLASRTRNLAAQATMSTGGYDTTGESGGFRANIRNAEKQRLLEEQERIVKTEDVKDRLVRVAEEEYKQRPEDVPTINKYVKALLDRGREEDERQAYKLLVKGYEETKQFSFRQKAGEVRLRQARRALGAYRDKAEANPDDQQAQENLRKAERKFLEMELEEYRQRVEAYPTDLALKHELGKREFQLGNFEEAIALFQESQHDPKLRSGALNFLGRAFYEQDWVDEAVDTFRRAIEGHSDESGTMGMELRYGLMLALQKKAEQERSLESATEAEKLASGIAIQQINFRDIKGRRNQLKELVQQLRQAG